ncbi:MAG TPA: hypothetical protein ENK43_15120 [Planctomycetes bacterium]|nr:hypothetical protein [Planctomycetota bacterium]
MNVASLALAGFLISSVPLFGFGFGFGFGDGLGAGLGAGFGDGFFFAFCFFSQASRALRIFSISACADLNARTRLLLSDRGSFIVILMGPSAVRVMACVSLPDVRTTSSRPGMGPPRGSSPKVV